MIELIHDRHSWKDEHAMDVLMKALRKQKVQAHIARELQRALAHAKDQKKGTYNTSHITTPSIIHIYVCLIGETSNHLVGSIFLR